MTRLLLVVWDRGSLYLPILLMGLLALGTYWLVESAPVATAPVAQRPVRHEPDYFMNNFLVRTFVESGKLKSEVFGKTARHYPDSDSLEIDMVRIRSFDEQGRLTTATANRAWTNDDASEVKLFGKARIVREAQLDKSGQTLPRIEFRGEFLHAYMDTERVISDQPVELRRGNDIFLADTMDFDNLKQVMNMRGRVKGTLVPVRTN